MKQDFKKQAVKLFLSKTNFQENDIKKITKCKSSFTNQSFKFATINNLFFQVRIGNNSLINRKNELEVYKELRIPFLFFDSQNGNMIRQWIDGKNVKKWNSLKINSLVDKMKQIHNINGDNILSFNAFIFTDLLSKTGIENDFYTEYISLLNKYSNEKNDIVCHCDLNPNNILYNKKDKQIEIIDFEWSRKNSIYFELANLARENMSKKEMLLLLNAYGNLDFKKFKDYLIITCLYAYQWSLSVPNNFKIKQYRKNIIKRLSFIRKLNFEK